MNIRRVTVNKHISSFKKKDITWFRRYEDLTKFVETYGRMPTYKKKSDYMYNVDEYLLMSWSARHRVLYKKGALDCKKIEMLEKIPFWFWSRDDKK